MTALYTDDEAHRACKALNAGLNAGDSVYWSLLAALDAALPDIRHRWLHELAEGLNRQDWDVSEDMTIVAVVSWLRRMADEVTP